MAQAAELSESAILIGVKIFSQMLIKSWLDNSVWKKNPQNFESSLNWHLHWRRFMAKLPATVTHITICLIVEKFIINQSLFVHLWMNIYGIKQIVYQPKKFGIRSLFVSIHLVHTETNTTITYTSGTTILALATLGDATQIELILSVLCHPRWPRRVHSLSVLLMFSL